MKKTETIEVEICDVCHRTVSNTSLMETCIICGKEYCYSCKGAGSNAFDQCICKDCIKRKDVRGILEQYLALRYHIARNEQKALLKALPKIPPEASKDEG